MLRRLHLALTITLAALLTVSIVMGVSAAARAKEQAVMARAMEAQARLQAEQARDAQDAISKRLKDTPAK